MKRILLRFRRLRNRVRRKRFQHSNLTGYFKETQTNTVSHDGNRYQGTYDLKNYDTSGNFLNEDTGTLRATRLSVH
jgi:hypothetical protein